MDSENINDIDYKVEDAILPGFRFHPTDEELVGFYLKRKVQHRSLSIELIKQVDIYKYDPWDLPKISSAGEKEWYFFCPRDRKYRNSARPNRVTGGGFWKATGTDRPIYSSDGSKCIGLKKSLVFYRGRAARGIKTDWMMHEFRLPSLPHPSPPNNKTYPANDAWAICRIFKKTNSMAQRAMSQSWVSEFAPSHHLLTQLNPPHQSPQNITFNNDFQHMNTTSFSPQNPEPSSYPLVFAPLETSGTATTSTVTTNSAVDGSSMFLNQQPSDSLSFDGPHEQFNDFLIEFPFSMPLDLPWDSPDMSSGYSTNICYTWNDHTDVKEQE